MSKKIKKLMNKPSLIKEWNDTSFNDLPKRWSGAYGRNNGLTEFEAQGGKDKIKLGKLYTDKDRPPFKVVKEEFAIDDKGWQNVQSMMKGFFEDLKKASGAIKNKDLKEVYTVLDEIDGRQLGIKSTLKRHMKKEQVTEGIKRWKVYIKGESKPLILTGKDEKDVKQIAYAMIRNSSVKIAKVVREGKLTEANKSLPPFEIAKRMMKSKYWNKVGKGFQEKIIKKFRGRGVTPKALDKWLPDYIDGKEIYALFEGKLTEGKRVKYRKNDWKKYNQLVKKGKSVMVQTAFGDQFAWEDGSNYGVFASEESGREIELDHDDIDMVEIF